MCAKSGIERGRMEETAIVDRFVSVFAWFEESQAVLDCA
jgi:hypothetical protein